MSLVPKPSNRDLRRLNADGRPFKKGDIREDGFIFRSYVKTHVTEQGFYKEAWLSPSAYKRFCSESKKAIKNCYRNKMKERRKLIDAIKLEQGCLLCGYNKHPVALDFDHINPIEKSFTIGTKYSSVSEELLLNEIKKCRVLCANCHRVETLKNKHNQKG